MHVSVKFNFPVVVFGSSVDISKTANNKRMKTYLNPFDIVLS